MPIPCRMLSTFYMFGNVNNKILKKRKEKQNPKEELKHFWKDQD